MYSRLNSYRNSGFTIVELLVVIVIIGVLAAITIVSYIGVTTRATNASLQSDLKNAETLLKLDQATNEALPINLATANGGRGITASSGTIYTYTVNNNTTPQTFCMTATKNNINYNITQDGNLSPGICPVFNLDAGNSSSYSGMGSNWTDLSGNGNNGTLSGGYSYSSSNNGAINFNGSNSRASITNNFNLNTQELTVSVWVNQSAYSLSGSSNPYVSDWNTWLPGSQKGFILRTYSTETAPSFWIADGTNYFATTSSQAISLNTWYNIVGVFKANSIFKIYINGIEKDSATAPSQYIEETTTPNYIGYGGINAGYLNGKIGNATVYNKALNPDEIMQNFNISKGRYGI